ncbi:hypothetical protein [Flavobacterium sp. Root420]|uniref:hypothetical protein n=1 Tax=Flavobacterium sp. Root420 TaxID=1736533 RepID=UPI0009E67BED|nr:hypothetical protein [Flavobacterium sp. Root420]
MILRNLKFICLATIAFLSANTTFAQETTTTTTESEIKNYDQGFRLGFGLNGGLPTDNAYDWSLGGDVRLQYDLSKRTSLTLTTGFTNLFMGKDENGVDVNDLGFIPAKAGFKAFIWEDQFYVLGEVGAGFAVTNGYNDTTFLWAPGIGYANKYIDISVRYEDYNKFKTNQVALRLAYGFDL